MLKVEMGPHPTDSRLLRNGPQHIFPAVTDKPITAGGRSPAIIA
jgi:hypothetical protein